MGRGRLYLIIYQSDSETEVGELLRLNLVSMCGLISTWKSKGQGLLTLLLPDLSLYPLD